MIVILNDQLFQLTDAVLVCIRILIHHTDKRDLCPYDKSHFVTGIIEVLRMLIMCQSNRICSQFFDHSCIFIMIFFCQCVSFIQHVLMTAHSTQRSLCTIEDEPFVRITGKAAHSNTCRDLIIRLISSLQSCCHCIQVWSVNLPKCRIRNIYFYSCLICRTAGTCHFVSFCIANRIQNSKVFVCAFYV